MKKNEVAQILIVEDHPLVRLGLSYSLASHPRFNKCGEADNEVDAWNLAESMQPDAAIVDLTLSSGTGLDFIKKLSRKRPDVTIVVSSMHDPSVYEARSKRAGACAYIAKDSGINALIAALEQAIFNPTVEDKSQIKRGEASVDSNSSAIDSLTDRELEIFRMIGRGMSTRQISIRQSKSIKTIESYRAKIKKKIGVNTTEILARDAVRWVYEHDAA